MIILKYKDIVKIDEKGLYYHDSDHIEKFIDFEICNSRFVKYMIEQNNLSIEEAEDLKQRSKTVAWRDVTARPMYIEFLSDPRIKFDFPRSLFCLNPYRKFSMLRQDVINVGWTTFDLS